jgi:Protein of unknown function (DUF3108)
VHIYKLFALLAVALFVTQDITAQERLTLKPYTARYNVSYRGLRGGDIEFTLKNDGNGRYIYSSHVLPNFLGGFFISDQAEDTSLMEFDGSAVKPVKFRSEDGSKNTRKDIRYDFDRTAHSVNGRYKDQDFHLEVPANTQDRLSIQLAASLALQAGREPGRLIMLEKDELQEYNITRVDTEQVRTAAGEYAAQVLKSERDGSSRTTRYWYAAKLGYIPVRAERSTNGKVDIVMELKSYQAL